jgi:glyoxylase I family protein
VERKIAQMGPDAVVTRKPQDFGKFIRGWRSAWLRDPAGNIIQITTGYTDQDNPPPLPPE